jgi:hypothetical protein
MRDLSSGIDPVRAIKTLLIGAACIVALAAAVGSARSVSQISSDDNENAPLQAEWHGFPEYTRYPAAAGRKMRELARKSGGDMNRLSADERTWMSSVASSYAPMALQMSARELHAEDAAKAAGSPANSRQEIAPVQARLSKF